MITWNPWHGCKKISAGCANCYMYRVDSRYDRDPSEIKQTGNFRLPLKKGRDGNYKIPSGSEVFTCGTSDFFLDEADPWRADAWQMIRQRCDVDFLIITKRIHRFYENLPEDWGDGYDNVTIGCTTENQEMADYRLPIFLSVPIKHRVIICEPILSHITLKNYLDTSSVEYVLAGGESGEEARICNHDWIVSMRNECMQAGIPFVFKQTGAKYLKNGKVYHIPRKLQHKQAVRSGLSYLPS